MHFKCSGLGSGVHIEPSATDRSLPRALSGARGRSLAALGRQEAGPRPSYASARGLVAEGRVLRRSPGLRPGASSAPRTSGRCAVPRLRGRAGAPFAQAGLRRRPGRTNSAPTLSPEPWMTAWEASPPRH